MENLIVRAATIAHKYCWVINIPIDGLTGTFMHEIGGVVTPYSMPMPDQQFMVTGYDIPYPFQGMTNSYPGTSTWPYPSYDAEMNMWTLDKDGAPIEQFLIAGEVGGLSGVGGGSSEWTGILHGNLFWKAHIGQHTNPTYDLVNDRIITGDEMICGFEWALAVVVGGGDVDADYPSSVVLLLPSPSTDMTPGGMPPFPQP